MKKIPCLFQRKFDERGRLVALLPEVTPGCEWVLAGEGIATRKWDGTACMVKAGKLYKRYDAKRDRKTGEYKMPPEGSIPCDKPDEVTGHWPHWVLVSGGKPEDVHHVNALVTYIGRAKQGLRDGTYELCGPHFNGNPEDFAEDTFVRHGTESWNTGPPESFDTIRRYLAGRDSEERIEGIVFHHPDGRMAKIRRADFGLPWGRK